MQDTIWANDGDLKVATVADLPWKENPVTGRRSSDSETEQANARLIASAPDMLDALQDVLWMIENSTAKEWNKDREAASRSRLRAAIAKATGSEAAK
jgi:hypothetical protein